MLKMPVHRRGPLVSILIFAVGLIASLLLIALLQLDIGTYKQQLAAQLEQALNSPVQLGDAELSFHGGIALDFRNLRIGDDNSFSLHVPQLTTILDPMGLLRGEIVIEQVLLDYPSLKLSLPLKLAKSTFDLSRLGLKTLQVRKGSLTIFYLDGKTKPLRLENFNLVLHSLGKGLVSQLATTATLFHNNRDTELKAFLELTRQNPDQPWRQGSLRGNISLNNLRRQLLGKWDIAGLPQTFNLAAEFEGIPSREVKINAVLNDDGSEDSLASLTFDWQSTPLHDKFSNLKLGLLGVPLTGYLHLDRQGTEPQLAGKIELGRTDLHTLLAVTGDHPLKNLSGQVTEMALSFKGPLHATAENPFSPIERAFVELDNIGFSSNAMKLTDVGLSLELQNGHLTLKQGSGQLAGVPFFVTGSSGRLDESPPTINLQVEVEADLKKLHTRFSTPFWKRQSLTGKVPLRLNLRGTFERILTEFKADLTQTNLIISKLVEKKPGDILQLSLHGMIRPNILTFSNARVKIGEKQIETTGELALKNGHWAGALLLNSVDVSVLQSISPIFDYFKIAGQIQGRVELGRSAGFTGQLEIKDGGARLTSVIGKLNRVNGTISLDRNGLDLGKLQARLGTSQLSISGALDNWRSPMLSLHVTSPKVRAQDLVFTNREMMLQDLDGHLLITSGGILFDRIAVTIENRTHAVIQGQMRSYRNPQTYLEIEADDAEILDMIRLFTGPPHSTAPHRPGFSPGLQLRAKLAKGTIDGLAFTDAVGVINDRHSLFTLEPLSFKIGKGTANWRIEFDRNRNHLLKISGRLDNFDFETLHQHFFKDYGILQGTISGDIYLEGEAGKGQFWKSSYGGGNLEVREGTLKKLRGLSQIFSILNITQLFKFQLPDIDQDGMPFSRLSISPRLEKGVFLFDNLQIESPAINMSAIGQLDSLKQSVDFTVGVKPLRTVDILLEKIPLVGWILTGKEKALITALFKVSGPLGDIKVEAVPVSTVSNTVLGILGRALTLPVKLIQDTGTILNTPPRPGTEPEVPEQINDN